MQDVARDAGVSRQLVSLVVRGTGYVAAEKRALVLESAERLGYRRNALAARLASDQTRSVGLLVLDLHNQVYADFADGVASVVEPLGIHLLLVRGSLHADSEARAIDSLVELRVDGLLLAGHSGDSEALRSHLAGTPAVAMSEVEAPLVDVVRGDDLLGAEIAVDHLVSQGCRRIAYLGSRAGLADPARHEGYLEIVRKAGLDPMTASGDTTESGGAAALAELLDRGEQPDGIFCYNDATAIGAMGEARRRGLSVPGDVAIVGYDNTRAASYSGVDLTSIDQRCFDIGRQAAQLLIDRLSDPRREVVTEILRPHLVVRASSRSTASA